MPSRNKCYYNGCGNTKKWNPELSFHQFPTSKERLLTWIECCGHKVAGEVDELQWQYRVICSNHFDRKYFKASSRPTLRKDAVPDDFNVVNAKNSENNNDSLQLDSDSDCNRNGCQNVSKEASRNSKIDLSREYFLEKALDNARLIIEKLQKRNRTLEQRIHRLRQYNKGCNRLRLISVPKIVQIKKI